MNLLRRAAGLVGLKSNPFRTSAPRAPIVRVNETVEPAKLYDSEPSIEVHRDCVYVPIIEPVNFWENPFWGVYDREGQLIDAAAFRDEPEMKLTGQSPTCIADIADAPYAPLDRYFYVGNVIPHYGHFLCSSMSRLWALTDDDHAGTPLIAHGVGSPDHWFSHPFVQTLFGAAGVVREDFAHFDHPVRIRELVIARPSFVERNLVHTVHARAAHKWGDALTKAQDLSEKLGMVYLSKMKRGAHPAGYSNEAPLVSVLEQAGVPIIHPEDLTLPEQVALFKRARLIMGQGGSQFHTSILTEPRGDQTLIQLVCDRTEYSTNHRLMDLANRNRALYLYFEGEWHQHEGGPPQLRLADPEAAARGLLHFARSL